MNDRQKPALVSQPTAEQMARFAALTPEQRFFWLTDLLTVCYDLATPEVRAEWRRHKRDQT